MNDLSLLFSFSLVVCAIYLSYKDKLGLEKELFISSFRAVIQLVAIGLVLHYIFEWDNALITTLLLIGMILNASNVVAKRGGSLTNPFRISFITLLLSTGITLCILLGCNAIHYKPSEIIPVGGMIVGNSMIALGLVFNTLTAAFKQRKEEIEIKLCLGASAKEASMALIRSTIKTALLPTIDSMNTLGIVQLPGMMTGLILAGLSPMLAIKYQIMVAFMLTGAVAITVFIGSYWAYRSFFNEQIQLIA